MKLKFVTAKNGVLLHEGIYDVGDAKSFGDACADVWMKLAERKLTAASSIGAVYEALGDNALPDMRAVQIRFERVDPQ